VLDVDNIETRDNPLNYPFQFPRCRVGGLKWLARRSCEDRLHDRTRRWMRNGMYRRAYRLERWHIGSLIAVRGKTDNLDMVMQREGADELKRSDTDAGRHVRDNEKYSHGVAPMERSFSTLCSLTG
jgi:hypothetical protein